MMDRIVAAAAAMPAALYVMAASVAWFRVVFPLPSASLAKRVMLDRAVAWSALSVIFSVVVAVKLGIVSWDDPRVGVILVAALVAFFVAGLVSVRAITMAAFGNRVLAVFAVVSIAVGLVILLG
jgi:hypothetical protein